MKKIEYTRQYYVNMWAIVLSSYQWWGHNFVDLLDNIEETNPIVSKVFYKLYRKEEDIYVRQNNSEESKFYQKLDSLIPDAEKIFTHLEVKSLKKENKKFAIKESLRQYRYNYLLTILWFLEEFESFSIKNKDVTSTKNFLSAQSKNIDVSVKRSKKTGVTMVRINIPCELCIEYSSSIIPME